MDKQRLVCVSVIGCNWGGRKEVLVTSYSFLLLTVCCWSNLEGYECHWAGNKKDGVPSNYFFFLILTCNLCHPANQSLPFSRLLGLCSNKTQL